ncbi:hypothetical protein PYCCODRAFT_1357773 [Trametes coccinea BRFM310]|uniref:AB hydrolase-1 domain-containing protein n=1 Tax=Trametes coccinea (strain BRFM310) TaxID=1353009 RepID=A0A1Y2J2N8_TRAC3|nr:hypothetical protein PYCCODRAFT_1357773 [Trametes coccinea BRFM310]
MPSLIVAGNGVELSYIDSGVPSSAEEGYTTIFAVHGTGFARAIFEKVMSLAKSANIRFVAINRRDFPGSTPFTPEDMKILASGTDDEKAAFVKARGLEFASFVDQFVVRNNIPPISNGGKYGGFALVGWSFGNSVTLSAVANVDSLDAPVRARWASRMRALVLHEPPTVAIGSPLPPKVWTPMIDQSIPEEFRGPMHAQWITSYFKHGDLSTRNLDSVSYVLPTTARVPTIYNIPEERLAEISYAPPTMGSDLLMMLYFANQLNASYKKACFDQGIRQVLPNLKVTMFAGDMSNATTYPAYWVMEDDDKASGGGKINFKGFVKGINHFVVWDEPELTLKAYMDAIF